MKLLSTGIENFERIIRDDYYYVDKTLLIKQLKLTGGNVTLYTRPRRFGKSLNISMLKYFFELGSDKSLFNGLAISKDKAFCAEYQAKYPVIKLSLKDVEGENFEKAFNQLRFDIGQEADRFGFLLESPNLTEDEKDDYKKIIARADLSKDTYYSMNYDVLSSSIFELTYLLKKHYGRGVVVLIDEYDVPLDKAHVNGYYDEMVRLIRSMFHKALKTNDNLEFAVLTGCLRVSKESIFTGMNNFAVNSITAENKEEYFGFKESEVYEMLDYYHLSDRKAEVKEWYDGYKFGDSDVYCPWDVVNFCREISSGERKNARSYWANTSSNDLVREFVEISTEQTAGELESLVAGNKISKDINEELTYRDIDSTIDNLWSVLFMTGYLTGYIDSDEKYILWIPNKEVQEIYEKDIINWFKSRVREDTESHNIFYNAALSGKPEEMEEVLNGLLFDFVSIRDTFTRKYLRENFYHGFVLGLLTGFKDIRSNSESGNGFSDILILNRKDKVAAILELKYSDSDSESSMEGACMDAISQAEKLDYGTDLPRRGLAKKIIIYGISFNKKQAVVRMDGTFANL